MLAFELSAIDLILAIAVATLLVLYLKKFSVEFPEEKYFRRQAEKQTVVAKKSKITRIQPTNSQCPRGFGNIRKLSADNSVSDRCLNCYRIMECYSERPATVKDTVSNFLSR